MGHRQESVGALGDREAVGVRENAAWRKRGVWIDFRNSHVAAKHVSENHCAGNHADTNARYVPKRNMKTKVSSVTSFDAFGAPLIHFENVGCGAPTSAVALRPQGRSGADS